MAIILVVLSHARLLDFRAGGMVGVTLFFVLSGFLITHLLIEEGEKRHRIDLRAFYGRRALRLFPALILYLAGIAVIVGLWDVNVSIWQATWPPIVYVANYAQIAGLDLFMNLHTWSLSVEEHFYLVWPILVALGATKRLKALGLTVVGLVAWRLISGAVFSTTWAYLATDANAYALGLGALIASIRHVGIGVMTHRWTAGVSVLALVGLGLMPVNSFGGLEQVSVWLPVLAAVAGGAAVWTCIDHDPPFLRGRAVRWFGLISYSLYLWHAPLLRLPGVADSRLFRIGAVAVAVLFAWLSWKFVESPILRSRLRQRLDRSDPLPDQGTSAPPADSVRIIN